MPKGRKPKNVEFLNTLKAIFEYPNVSAFSRACGKKTSNMTNYLTGNLVPGKSVLRTAITHLSEWSVQIEKELEKIPTNLQTLPTKPGIYILYSSSSEVLYVGQATNLRTEVRQTLDRAAPVPIRFAPHLNQKTHPKFKKIATHISLYVVPSRRLRHNLEALLLRISANQTHNTNFGKFL